MKKRNKAIIRQAAKQAGAIRAGIGASFVAGDVVESWLDAYGNSEQTAAAARSWARAHVNMNSEQLWTALTGLYATAWQLGSRTAAHSYAENALAAGNKLTPEFRVALSTNWDTWKPGNRAAALVANPPKGFSSVLARRDIVLNGINNTTADRIGTILSTGLAEGKTREQVAAELVDRIEALGDDPRRALTIANTEMNAAVQGAQIQSFIDNGVTQMEWSVVQPCDVCAENDGEIRDIGEPFPSGDTAPEVHPNCMCDLIPVVDLMEGDTTDNTDATDNADNIDLAVTPDLTKTVPGPLEVERALSRLAILPNPPIADMNDIEKYVESPWAVIPAPTVAPLEWDKAEISLINIADLKATDPYLSRKKVRKHIKAMGQALTPNRSFALVAVVDGVATIIDGHHRLMSLWLLGLEQAPVWLIEE